MGGEVMLRLATGQRKAVDKLIKKVAPEDGSLVGPGCAHKEPHCPHCWLQWSDSDLWVAYSLSYGNSDWALAVAMAICKRFKVVKAGWTSVGYCKDMAEFNRAKPFGCDVRTSSRMMKEYLKIKPGHEFVDGSKATKEQIDGIVDRIKREIATARKYGREYVRAAEKMFAKAESR